MDPNQLDGNVFTPGQQSTPSPGTYYITISANGLPLWNPAKGSQELSEALKIHFPAERNTTQRMLAALAKFNRERSPGTHGIGQAAAETNIDGSFHVHNPISESFHLNALSNQAPRLAISENGSTSNRDKEKTESAQNRGMVCDYHRQTHTKCNPKTCPENKRYNIPSHHRKSSSSVSCKSLSPGGSQLTDGSPVNSAATPRSSPALHLAASGQFRAEFCEQGEYELAPGSTGTPSYQSSGQDGNNQAPKEDEAGGGSSGGGSSGGSHDRYQYGDYGRPFDEDPDNSPFNGANKSPGGGYPKPNGGYYCLKNEIYSDNDYTFSIPGHESDFSDALTGYDYYTSSTRNTKEIAELEDNLARISIR